MVYFNYFIISFIFSLLAACIFILIANKLNILDRPNCDRKMHEKATPLLGGMAVFFSFFITIFLVLDKLTATALGLHHWLGFFIGACFLMIGGFLDDKFNLAAKIQIIFPVLAALSVIIGGVGIEKISNPFGGYIRLDMIDLPLLTLGGYHLHFAVLSGILIFLWLMGMMYTTKLLDGVDGLVTSVTGVGSLIIFLFTVSTKYYQPDIALASIIFAGACLGFLIFNWHPARIFLGEGGSLLMGYILGVLAIISGGKIAIAMLVMGLPILDVIWTILRRLRQGKNPFKFADRKHLHFRLLDLGFGPRLTVLTYVAFAAIFGLSAVYLQSLGKLFALALLILIMIGIIAAFNYLDKKSCGSKY